MSLTFKSCTSTGLSPVSLLSVSLVARVLPELAISILSFSSVGILIGLLALSYFGLVQGIF